MDRTEPNGLLQVDKTEIIAVDGTPLRTPVRVAHRLSPQPWVVIRYDNCPEIVQFCDDNRHQVALENGSEVNVFVRRPGLTAGHSGVRVYGTLVPVELPQTVIDKGNILQSVEFSLLNFQEFFGQQDLWVVNDDQNHRLGQTKLVTDGWIVTLTSVKDSKTALETLRAEGGHAVTHTGTIARSDRGEFSVSEAEDLIEGLRLFLSFARGSACSFTLVEGKDRSGEQSWVRWGSKYVAPWRSEQSWCLKIGGGDTLSDIFPGFWSLYTSGQPWKDTILRTVDWYLNSNESAMHAGIILTQAALERLSYQILGTRVRPAAEAIRKALTTSNLDTKVPSHSVDLEQFRSINGFCDGPETFVKVRNDFVHPQQALQSLSSDILRETRDLGLWYVELMLLKSFGYKGKYNSRLSGQTEKMP